MPKTASKVLARHRNLYRSLTQRRTLVETMPDGTVRRWQSAFCELYEALEKTQANFATNDGTIMGDYIPNRKKRRRHRK